MFFIQEKEVCSFTDDTSVYSCLPKFEEATLKLSNDKSLILKWFRSNSIVANLRKFQITLLRSNTENNKIEFIIENKSVNSGSKVKLLDITINNKLPFTTHTENLCCTASKRLWTLPRIHTFLSFEQAERLSETFWYQLSGTVLWSGRFVVKLQIVLLTKSINAAYVLHITWKIQISQIY